MRKIFVMTLAVLLAALAFASGRAAQAGEDVQLRGWIVDQSCGKANAGPEGKDCILACAKGGSPLMLAAEDGLYLLSDQKAALANVGHEVLVTGKVDGKGGIRVESIVKLPKKT